MSTTAIRMSGPSPSPSYVPRSSSSRPSSPSMPAFSGAAGPSGRNPTPLLSPSLPPKPEPYTGPTRGGLSSGHGTHHRSTSLPTSPALTPRLASMERRGSSHLRHEVVRLDNKGSQSQPRQRVITEGAKAILKMMANLPAPLPAELPTKFLPTPNPTPSPPSSASFAQYARGSTPSRKRRHESALGSESDSDISSSSATRLPDRKPVGLGLGLSMAMGSSERGEVNGPSKKRKASPGLSDLVRSASHSGSKPLKSPEIHRSSSVSSITTLANKDRGITPLGSPGLPSATFPKRDIKGQSSLRHELDSTDDAKTMANWSKDKWREMSSMYRTRALLVKRHGDAYQRSQSAQPHLTSVLPADPLRGLLCFSDAVLLWLFSYWGGEQADVRVRGTPYHESRPLREFVRRGWENEMRNAEDESKREMARAMVGLMHMIEAVVSYHLSTEYLAHLSKRGQEIVSASTMHGRSPPSSSGSPPSATGPSPVPSHSATTGTAGTMPSNSAQPGSSSSPDSHSSQSNMISDLMPLIVNSTGTSSKAQTFLLTSRHHLSLRILRNRFPITFDYAINSELADEALPAPGDMLGSAKKLDIDHVERFAWPIELGMHCPVAHTAVFGRSMVKEYAEATGGAWELHLEG